MICFCQCERDYHWGSEVTQAYCLCGRKLEPMTLAEHTEAVTEAVAQYKATGRRLLITTINL